MRMYVEFEDSKIGIISNSNIEKFSFICSIFKVFAMSNLVVKDFAKDTFNVIKSGMPVNVVFVDDEGKEYINRMCVLSFTKIPGPQVSFKDTLDITLISSIYFDNSSGIMVHEGSVGSIYENIMSKFFKTSVYSYSGTTTNDLPARRYQTSERTLDFMKRILKYGIKEDMPVYLFYDAKGVLNFKGIKEMSLENPKLTAVPPISDLPQKNQSSSVAEGRIVMWNFISSFDGRKTASQIITKFTSANFRFQKMVQSNYSFKGAENFNNQVEEKIPPKTKFLGWNLTPTDAQAIASKESFEETCKTCSIVATFRGLDVMNLGLGDTINIKLPYDQSAHNSLGEASNLGEGRYLITDLDFTASKDDVVTTATMIQVAC